MSEFATIYGLLYGNDYKLHKRFLDGLFVHTPAGEASIRLWCNTVCQQTKDLLETHQRSTKLDAAAYFSDENVPKYKAMGVMFREMWIPTTPWIVWFDDDSYIENGDWWSRTRTYLEKRTDVCYMGQPWYVHHLPGQWAFIQKATWFKGKPSELCPTKKKGVCIPGITFAQGAYWWLKTDLRNQIDWPDPRLSHNGGDTLLGEAVRQQGKSLTKYYHGVVINKAKRRGISERPAGSSIDTRR